MFSLSDRRLPKSNTVGHDQPSHQVRKLAIISFLVSYERAGTSLHYCLRKFESQHRLGTGHNPTNKYIGRGVVGFSSKFFALHPHIHMMCAYVCKYLRVCFRAGFECNIVAVERRYTTSFHRWLHTYVTPAGEMNDHHHVNSRSVPRVILTPFIVYYVNYSIDIGLSSPGNSAKERKDGCVEVTHSLERNTILQRKREPYKMIAT